jgi:hypothetical protein
MNKKRDNYIQKTIQKLKTVEECKQNRKDLQVIYSEKELLKTTQEILSSSGNINDKTEAVIMHFLWHHYDDITIEKTLKLISRAEDRFLRKLENNENFKIFKENISNNFLEVLSKLNQHICRIELLDFINSCLVGIDRESVRETAPKAKLRELFSKVSPIKRNI